MCLLGCFLFQPVMHSLQWGCARHIHSAQTDLSMIVLEAVLSCSAVGILDLEHLTLSPVEPGTGVTQPGCTQCCSLFKWDKTLDQVLE